MCVVGGNDQNTLEVPCDISFYDDRQDKETTLGWNSEQSSCGYCHQVSGDSDTWYIHRQAANYSGGLGGIDTYL